MSGESPEGQSDGYEILDAMRAGIEYRQPIRVRKWTVQLRPLSILETNEIAQEVQDELEEMKPNQRTRMAEHTLLAKKTLVRASTPDPERNSPTITELVLDKFTNDEIHYVYKQYSAIEDKVNPALEELSKESLELLVERVKKSPSELIELSFLELVNLSRHLLTRND